MRVAMLACLGWCWDLRLDIKTTALLTGPRSSWRRRTQPSEAKFFCFELTGRDAPAQRRLAVSFRGRLCRLVSAVRADSARVSRALISLPRAQVSGNAGDAPQGS